MLSVLVGYSDNSLFDIFAVYGLTSIQFAIAYLVICNEGPYLIGGNNCYGTT